MRRSETGSEAKCNACCRLGEPRRTRVRLETIAAKLVVAFPARNSRVIGLFIQFVGPIARVLVQRAAANATNVEALWQTLAHHIEFPAELAAFLRKHQK